MLADFHLFSLVPLQTCRLRSAAVRKHSFRKVHGFCRDFAQREGSITTLNINREERYNFINEMATYLSHHSGCKIELLSLEVLHDVYGLN